MDENKINGFDESEASGNVENNDADIIEKNKTEEESVSYDTSSSNNSDEDRTDVAIENTESDDSEATLSDDNDSDIGEGCNSDFCEISIGNNESSKAEIDESSDMGSENSEQENAIEESTEAKDNSEQDTQIADNADSEAYETQKEVPPTILYRWDYNSQFAHDNASNTAVKKKKNKGVLTYAIIMTVAFLLAFSILIVSISLDDLRGFKEELTVSDIVDIGMPSTVYIMGIKGQNSGSSGSGFAISNDGYIVTNYHVIEDCKQIVVIDAEGEDYHASVVGYDKTLDIAVLYAEQAYIPAVTIGNSNELKLGDKVVAIGNPESENLMFSVTDGIVSGLNRTMSGGKTMIQTNLPVNPGNSGGPMFDGNGNLVGIITSKMMYGNSGENGERLPVEGISFAIPISNVLDILNGYIEKDLNKPVLGVTAVSVEKDKDYFLDQDLGGIQPVVKENGLYYVILPGGLKQTLTDDRLHKDGNKLFHADATGIYITKVTKGLGAYGKLKEGDIVTKMGDISVASVANVKDIFKKYSVGDSIKVEFYRDGKLSSLEMTLKTKGDMLDANRE